VASQDGPSHQPVFSIVAWATTPGGRTWRSVAVAIGKKIVAVDLFDKPTTCA
jgi:hypothetical protein